MRGGETVRDGRTHALVLWVLLGAFCFRVAAQLLQARWPVAWLPPFEAWQSGALPYAWLVAFQAVFIVVYTAIARGVGAPATRPNRRFGVILITVGTIYLGFMLARLGLGLTILDGHPWWDRPIPSSFHLVLASFLLVAGDYHRRGGRTRIG